MELRKLTERLIISTRQHLERDKENLQKWKEKHRKRRETMAANAANARSKIPGAGAGLPPSAANRDRRASANEAQDQMMISIDFVEEDNNGQTPEESALAEHLRLQYAGNTGLHRKSALNAPYPQYTKPDGSVIQVPLVRYNPREDHWGANDPTSVDLFYRDSTPELYCDSLPPSREYNPCRPRAGVESILVRDYAQSLYNFVGENGPVATEIVTELLSPELAVKAMHDEFKRQGLNQKEIEKRIKDVKRKRRSAATLYRSRHKWDAQSIMKLADDIERMNKRVISVLPKLKRSINELDGIKGLQKFLDKDLVREVDDVPDQVVDFAMPHGVSLSTINEIYRIGQLPALQLTPAELSSLDVIRRAAKEFLSHVGAEAASQMTGASLLSPNELHEHQQRALAVKRQRKQEAERQAAFIQEQQRKAGMLTSFPAAAVASGVGGMHPPGQTGKVRGSPRAKLENSTKSDGSIHKPVQAAPSFRYSSEVPTSVNVTSGVSAQQAHRGGNSSPPAKKDAFCGNCGTRDTLGWRATATGPNRVERLCTPCGLYWQKTNQHRPKEMWMQSLQLKQHHAAQQTMQNSGTAVRPTTQTIPIRRSSTSSPNGIARLPIQKTISQSGSRRSPSSGGSQGNPNTQATTGAMLRDNALASQGFQGVPGMIGNVPVANDQVLGAQRPVGSQVIPAHRQHISHNNPIPNSSLTHRNLQVVQNQMQRANPAIYAAGSNGVAAGGSGMHPLGQNVLNNTMYGRSPVTALDPQPPRSGVHAGVSAGFIPVQKHSFVQGHPGADSIGAQAKVPVKSPYRPGITANVHVNPNQMNPKGLLPHAASSSTQSTGIAQPLKPIATNDRISQGGQQDRQVQVGYGNVGFASSGLNSIQIPQFVNPHAHTNPSVNSTAFNDGRGPFGSNGAMNGATANTEQMMESLLFGEGDFSSSPTGPPEFDF